MHAMGHRADWKQCSVKLVDFLSRRLSSTFRWNGRGIVCLPLRIPVFLKIKIKKSRSGRKIGAVGDDKQLIFFTRPYIRGVCTFGALQPTANFSKNKRVLIFRGAYLFTRFYVTGYSLKKFKKSEMINFCSHEQDEKVC